MLDHVGFSVADNDGSSRAVAYRAGGQDDGAPGIQAHYHPNYYAAFVLDPEGLNVEAMCHSLGVPTNHTEF